jgi:hypothetical protein
MGAIDTNYTFTATDVITSTKMNNILDQSTITATAIIGTTLAVTTGKLSVAAGGVTSNELGANAVTTTAILDANVTTAKIADLNVTTAKIVDSAVTTAKILDANVTAAKIADASITAPKLNGAQTGTAPIFGARAYGAFNGTAASPITPIKAGNIASITRIATGLFTVVMTTAMENSSYCVVANATHSSGVTYGTNCFVTITNSTTFNISTGQVNGTLYNSTNYNFVVFQ